MDMQQIAFLSAGMTGRIRTDAAPQGQTRGTQSAGESRSFGAILTEKARTDELKFSRHAQLRMSDRGMEMTGEQMKRLQGAAQTAAEKGIKDSLVMVDDMAFIVNVPNRTVVTVMDPASQEQNVFTNINGAVIA